MKHFIYPRRAEKLLPHGGGIYSGPAAGKRVIRGIILEISYCLGVILRALKTAGKLGEAQHQTPGVGTGVAVKR